MIKTPSGKTLMNLQEAVQWLLDNNPLPFQCTANYAAGTEIGLGTIVNPTPAKVRVGSLIFFADSKVSTVIAITSNSFICSDEYNDLVDDVVYVSNVALNASGHLIVTLSNGDTIDAGLIKQVTGLSIDASQHLIVSFNDGTSMDLGAIFNGNITISGNLTVSGSINGEANPSVKPIYYHPIYIFDDNEQFLVSCLMLDNDPTPYTWPRLKSLIDNNTPFSLQPLNGTIITDDNTKMDVCRIYNNGEHVYAYGHLVDNSYVNAKIIDTLWANLFAAGHTTQFIDTVNKIN